PFIRWHCQSHDLPIATAGSSMGAYHAANTLFRHPSTFKWCICMSGIYDLSRYWDGYFDERCYLHNPVSYMANLRDPVIRWDLHHCSINLICGQGPWERVGWTEQMHHVLMHAGIRHNF